MKIRRRWRSGTSICGANGWSFWGCEFGLMLDPAGGHQGALGGYRVRQVTCSTPTQSAAAISDIDPPFTSSMGRCFLTSNHCFLHFHLVTLQAATLHADNPFSLLYYVLICGFSKVRKHHPRSSVSTCPIQISTIAVIYERITMSGTPIF